jgi:hypothetical protein
MSSDFTKRHMDSDDLALLQKVLADAGYSDESVTDVPTSIAAKLLIGLFQQGITDPADLTIELERSFGKPAKMQTIGRTLLHQYAISGVPQGYVQPAKAIYCLLPKHRGSQVAR